jgi:hypothetical protein
MKMSGYSKTAMIFIIVMLCSSTVLSLQPPSKETCFIQGTLTEVVLQPAHSEEIVGSDIRGAKIAYPDRYGLKVNITNALDGSCASLKGRAYLFLDKDLIGGTPKVGEQIEGEALLDLSKFRSFSLSDDGASGLGEVSVPEDHHPQTLWQRFVDWLTRLFGH